MSPISNFKTSLYKILNTNDELKNIIKNIYISIPNNATYPYVQIGKINIKDNSTKTSIAWQITLTINFWSNDSNSNTLFDASHIVQKIFSNLSNNKFNEFRFIRSQYINSELNSRNSGDGYQLATNYKIIIEEKENVQL